MRREAEEEEVEERRRRAAPLRLSLNTWNHPEGENGQRAAGVSILDAAAPFHYFQCTESFSTAQTQK